MKKQGDRKTIAIFMRMNEPANTHTWQPFASMIFCKHDKLNAEAPGRELRLQAK